MGKIMLKKSQIILLTMILSVLCGTIFYNSSVKVSFKRDIIEKYNKFFLCKITIDRSFMMNTDVTYRIWFLPGQKKKMLKSMSENINDELTSIVSQNSNLIRYNINDEFTRIYIYYNSKTTKMTEVNGVPTPDRLSSLLYQVKRKMHIYNQFINGYDSGFSDDFINFIEAP